MTHGVNDTSVFTVDPRSAADFLLPDTTDAGDDAEPYDVRGVDEITVLVDNGADQDATIVIETFAFNTPNADGTVDDADAVYGPVTDKEGSDSTTVEAGTTDVVSIGVAALAFIQTKATYGTGPGSGTLTVTYQGDRQG